MMWDNLRIQWYRLMEWGDKAPLNQILALFAAVIAITALVTVVVRHDWPWHWLKGR